MAKQNPPEPKLTVDRRQLLAITVAGVLPTEPSEAAPPAGVVLAPAPIPVAHPPALNLCAATARRIEEIVARNRIRQEAQLPLLCIPGELRRMKTADDLADFERFAAHHMEAVWEEILARPERPVWLPPGTLRVRGNLVCASLKGLSFEPYFNLTRTGDRSFRGSVNVWT